MHIKEKCLQLCDSIIMSCKGKLRAPKFQMWTHTLLALFTGFFLMPISSLPSPNKLHVNIFSACQAHVIECVNWVCVPRRIIWMHPLHHQRRCTNRFTIIIKIPHDEVLTVHRPHHQCCLDSCSGIHGWMCEVMHD